MPGFGSIGDHPIASAGKPAELMDFVSSALPLLSLRVRGLWATTIIFYVVGNQQRVRSASEYDLSAKNHLAPYQSAFAAAVAAWQILSAVKKKKYQARAGYLNRKYSGYNLYISMALNGEALL